MKKAFLLIASNLATLCLLWIVIPQAQKLDTSLNNGGANYTILSVVFILLLWWYQLIKILYLSTKSKKNNLKHGMNKHKLKQKENTRHQ